MTLIAAYLVKRFGGDVRRVGTVPPPEPGEPRSEQARRILREYDECLSEPERRLLVRISVFRTPATLDAVRSVAELTDEAAWNTVRRSSFNYLLAARVLRRDANGRYGLHPLIRDYYVEQGSRDADEWRRLHSIAQQYYLSALVDPLREVRLDDLVPAIEAAHHACHADSHDQASDIVYDHLYQAERALITSELNAYETTLAVFLDFFPNRELHREPLVSDPQTASWVLHEVATCLQMLGRLREAAGMFRRAGEAFTALEQWHDAAISCQNMTDLNLSLGSLPACRQLVDKALALAGRAGDKEDELVAETLRGASAHLEGRVDEAEDAFAAALRIAAEHTPVPALYSSSGVRYAEHLHRSGRSAEAAAVHRANIKICRAAGWQADIGLCRVGLGDIALAAGDLMGARMEYEEAVGIARGITRRDVLIAAFLGRARWAIQAAESADALADVSQALQMAVVGGYRLAEVDARILLARLRARGGELEAAWSDLTYATELSVEIGYYWGRYDAQRARADIDRLTT